MPGVKELSSDIKGCFDKIGHQWLMDNITMDKRMLEQWLKSGFVDKGLFYNTDEDTSRRNYFSNLDIDDVIGSRTAY